MSPATEDAHHNAGSNTGTAYGRAAVPRSGVPTPRAGDHVDTAGQASLAVPAHDIPSPSAAAPTYERPPPNGLPRPDRGHTDDNRRPRRRVMTAAVVAVVVIALFGAAAVAYSQMQPIVYGAQTEILLSPRAELSDAAVDRAMVTQTMIAQSDPVLQPVASQVGIPLSQLREEVSADIVGRSNVLRLTVGDRTRNRAMTLAQLITTEYLRVATESASQDRPGSVTGTGTTRGPVSATGDNPPPLTSAVLSPPSPLDQPLSPKPLRALAAGVLLGLIVAGGVVVVLLRPRVLPPPSAHWT